MLLNGFIKYDFKENKVVHKIEYGDDRTAGEVVFHPKEGGKEDEGYLMTFLYDITQKQSEFIMWDGKTCEVIYRVKLPQRVPHGFHGLFVDEDDLD